MKRITEYHEDIPVIPKRLLFEAAQKLADYEDIGLNPDQIREFDRIYEEKCREVKILKNRLKKLGEQL